MRREYTSILLDALLATRVIDEQYDRMPFFRSVAPVLHLVVVSTLYTWDLITDYTSIYSTPSFRAPGPTNKMFADDS